MNDLIENIARGEYKSGLENINYQCLENLSDEQPSPFHNIVLYCVLYIQLPLMIKHLLIYMFDFNIFSFNDFAKANIHL